MESETAKGRGRPRSFDRGDALDRAMVLFWQHGYEATSLAQLTTAMGISPPSLYSAFGDKEALFFEAVERYQTKRGDDVRAIVEREKTAREGVMRMLEGSAAALTDPRYPRGCMVVLSAITCSDGAARVQAKLASCRAVSEVQLRERIERGVQEGDVPATANPAALASLYMAVIQGMSLHARDGATREQLQAVGAAAMAAWPAMPAQGRAKKTATKSAKKR